ESFKVTSPPVPGSQPVSLVIRSRNSVPFVVTVKVTQRLSGASAASKNTSGRPNSFRSSARRFHNAQDRPPPGDRDGAVIDPADGDAARRGGEADIRDKGAGQEVHAPRLKPGDQRFDERLVLVQGGPP